MKNFCVVVIYSVFFLQLFAEDSSENTQKYLSSKHKYKYDCIAKYTDIYRALSEEGAVKGIREDFYFLGTFGGQNLPLPDLFRKGVSVIKENNKERERENQPIGFWFLGIGMIPYIVVPREEGEDTLSKDFHEICGIVENIEIGPLKDEMILLAGLKEMTLSTQKDVYNKVNHYANEVLYSRSERILEKLYKDKTELSEQERSLATAWLNSVVYSQAVPDWLVEKIWEEILQNAFIEPGNWWRKILLIQIAPSITCYQSYLVKKKHPDWNVDSSFIPFIISSRLLKAEQQFENQFDENNIKNPDFLNKFAYFGFMLSYISTKCGCFTGQMPPYVAISTVENMINSSRDFVLITEKSLAQRERAIIKNITPVFSVNCYIPTSFFFVKWETGKRNIIVLGEMSYHKKTISPHQIVIEEALLFTPSEGRSYKFPLSQ
jgi:hypothetical protein